MTIVRKWAAALAKGGRRPRVERRAELSSLGMERLEGRELQSQLAHLAPAEIATIRADHQLYLAEHHHNPGTGTHHAGTHHHK